MDPRSFHLWLKVLYIVDIVLEAAEKGVQAEMTRIHYASPRISVFLYGTRGRGDHHYHVVFPQFSVKSQNSTDECHTWDVSRLSLEHTACPP